MELLLNNKGQHRFFFCLNVLFVNCRCPQGFVSCLIPNLWLLWSWFSGQTLEPMNNERASSVWSQTGRNERGICLEESSMSSILCFQPSRNSSCLISAHTSRLCGTFSRIDQAHFDLHKPKKERCVPFKMK